MKALVLIDKCGGCGVPIGETHKPGCDQERCPFCGVQMLQDDCCYTFFGIDPDTMEETYPHIYEHGLTDEMQATYEKHLAPHLLRYDGVFPGTRECREYNLWCKWVKGKGWQSCDADDPDATEDLNELFRRSVWEKDCKRYVMKKLDML